MIHGDDVHVWLIDLRQSGRALREAEDRTVRLSRAEMDRAGTHPDQAAAEYWLAARIALRIALEAVAGPGLRGRPFELDLAGKPFLPGYEGIISFNLSHSGPFVLVAISREAVGVDVEQARRTRFPHSARTLLISAAQALAGEPRAPNDRPADGLDGTLLQAWVRLEAVAKATGCGIGPLLNDVGMRGPAKTADASAVADRAAAIMVRERLKLEDLPLPQGLWGAVATSAASGRLLLREFPADPEQALTMLATA